MRHSILVALMLLLGLPALAVTDREMEEAKTITAITYLRYANDLSGYLDDHHPKTMAELEAILKPKEKENLKTFTAVKTPTDYASWDKEKLVGYWAGTFYSSPGLLAKGKIGKSRTRSRLNAMKVAAPQQTKSETPQPKPEPPQPQAETQQPQTETPQPQTETPQPQTETPQPQAQISESEADSLIEQANTDAGLAEEDQPRKNNSTWIYVVILIVLVGVVVWLVVYASKTMRREDQRRRQEEVEKGTASVSDNIAERAANAAMREKYSESLNQKNTELRQAQKEAADLRAEIEELRRLNARQAEEITRLRNGLAAMAGTAPQPSNHGSQTTSGQPQATSNRAANTGLGQQDENPRTRTIYLGRVNQRGLFVRADKTPHPDLSVYSLQTEDGYSGTFRVIENADIDSRLLSNPGEWLSGGCTGLDTLASIPDAELIHTESGGTAIFEGGAWKVIRKARISFS